MVTQAYKCTENHRTLPLRQMNSRQIRPREAPAENTTVGGHSAAPRAAAAREAQRTRAGAGAAWAGSPPHQTKPARLGAPRQRAPAPGGRRRGGHPTPPPTSARAPLCLRGHLRREPRCALGRASRPRAPSGKRGTRRGCVRVRATPAAASVPTPA